MELAIGKPVSIGIFSTPMEVGKLAEGNYGEAHIEVNTKAFGIPQDRKLFIVILYDQSVGPFNIKPPKLPRFVPTTFDAFWSERHNHTSPMHPKAEVYDRNRFYDLSAEDWHDCEFIYPKESLKVAASRRLFQLCKQRQKDQEDGKLSPVVGPKRVWWTQVLPTIRPSASRYLHPTLHRPLTIGELALACGSQEIPTGPAPVYQLVQMTPPPVEEWVAKQVELFLSCSWGTKDFQSSYNAKTGKWEGESFTESPAVKVFDLSQYYPRDLGFQRFPVAEFTWTTRPPMPFSSSPWNPWSTPHAD